MNIASLWSFWQNTSVGPLSEGVRRQLATERGMSVQATARLHMVVQSGQYAGRKVSYFRVFDPRVVETAGVSVHRFGDLDHHQRLQVCSGHTEREGDIVLTRQQADPSGNVL